MSDNPTQNKAETGRESRLVKVWDLPTRVFHWSLVSMVFIGIITGYIAPEWWMGLHVWAGYITVTLLVFRLVWGMFGSEYARLETFTFSPVHILEHMKEIISLRPVRHYIGHNPSGAVMIFALLFVLSVITVSGLLVLGGEENQGPLAGAASYAISEIAAPIHNIFVIILIAMIVMHVSGVILEGKLTGENLVSSMFTGLKRVPKGTPPLVHRRARPFAAFLVTATFFAIGGSLLAAFATMPPSGLRHLPANETYETECGDCHAAFHPSLLPAKSWADMMATLDDHFGEDASLDAETANEIALYLAEYAGEEWDTEAANRFRVLDPKHPMQITATPYWVRKHDEIDPETFKRKGIGVKSNCSGCHTDHYSGRFDDQKIKIPEVKVK
ncbi:MAG: cytochrome b/b6 domain-containing protein [Rhodospirillaceae bacterium]|nr:cytochrome b/b6 domain-containing protein [Rhodospirillaceae bacterium]